MNPRFSNQRNQAMTLVEVLVVIAMLAILAAMLLPANTGGPRKARRINCVNNLKQISIAYYVWASDNNGKFPMEVSMTNGGTMELVANGKNAWLNFLVMSNELNTPRILYCTADADHAYAAKFSSDLQSSVSYFVGLNAATNYPHSFLSGDDNFEINGVPVKSGLLQLSTNHATAWTAARHMFTGNIGFADGSVQQLGNSGFTNLLH
jgi:prepilin-type N-terminal cleavage/methylation domain-containing protein/prepilin-type processing-associated H-X9-DG protein